MFSKLAFVILSLGVVGCSLLALRQGRLQVASELTQAQLRINAADERLWLLRARIAQGVTPEQIELMAQSIGPLRPVVEAPTPQDLLRLAEEARLRDEAIAKAAEEAARRREGPRREARR